MKRIIIFLIGLMVFGLSACKKGDMGPQGPQGEKGERGAQGVAGVNGTKILSGATVPAADLGAIGDYYLRTSSSVLYGPKTNEGWGTGVSLKGAAGATGATGTKGADGTKMLSGTAVPTTAQGAIGDFYFQTSTGVLFGPKVSGGWGTGISLKGPQGDKGDAGNANVKVYEISRRVFTGTLNIDLPIDYTDAIKLNMLVYAQWGNPIRQVPFRVPNFMVEYSTFPYNGKFRVSLSARNPSTYELHPNQLVFPLTRIVFIEASDVTRIASQGVDLADYNQVKAALKF